MSIQGFTTSSRLAAFSASFPASIASLFADTGMLRSDNRLQVTSKRTYIVVFLIFFALQSFAVAAELNNYTNSIGMEFVPIAPGSFMMGSPSGADVPANEMPQHQVTISKPFYMGRHEVTQAQWEAIMGNNPSEFKGAALPVEQVSWEEAQQFIRRLNAKEKIKAFRLPTESEWEYVARSGTTTRFYWGNDTSKAGEYAWYRVNSNNQTHPVGQKQPNAWGLYDMSGNVWEWCQDRYDPKFYRHSPEKNPLGVAGEQDMLLRGGGWHNAPALLRSAIRYNDIPGGRSPLFGFRVVMDLRDDHLKDLSVLD